LHYWLLDENRLPEQALPPQNAVTAMLLLERSHGPAEMLNALDLLLRWLDADAQRPLRRSFAIWVQRVLLRERLAGQTFPELNELYEVRDMLSEGVKSWTEQWKNEGLEKGRMEGETALLLRQLSRRFGPVSESTRQRISLADAETLLVWGERLLDARSLEEIWGH
jgi:hypothetical protein